MVQDDDVGLLFLYATEGEMTLPLFAMLTIRIAEPDVIRLPIAVLDIPSF